MPWSSGTGSAAQLSALCSWTLCFESSLPWWVTALPGTELQATLGALARVLMDSVGLNTLEFLLCGILIPQACSVVGTLGSLFWSPVCQDGSGERRGQVLPGGRRGCLGEASGIRACDGVMRAVGRASHRARVARTIAGLSGHLQQTQTMPT